MTAACSDAGTGCRRETRRVQNETRGLTAERGAARLDRTRAVGLLHPESATWTLDGKFDFAKKVEEFQRAGTALQFAPDGVARAVKIGAADFKSKTEYVIEWLHGASNPTESVTPS